MEIRKSSRLIIIDDRNRLLLFQYKDEHNGIFWATAGGKLKENESYREAATRELHEETGLELEIGNHIKDREEVFAIAHSKPAIWQEKYFLVRCPGGAEISPTGWTELEKCTIRNWRWWSLDEMNAEGHNSFKPEWLANILAEQIEQFNTKIQ